MKLVLRTTMMSAVATMFLYPGVNPPAASQTVPARKAASSQAAPATRPSVRPAPARQPAAVPGRLMAEQVYKNIKVLRGLSEDEFMNTMAFISGGLGTNCTHCHSTAIASANASRWEGFAVDTPLKQTAREMISMVNRVNATYFGGANIVTCYTCHRGLEDPPKVVPELALQYTTPSEEEPEQFVKQDPNSPLPDQILDKYIQAIGGAERVANMKSFVAKGSYSGYDTDFEAVPMEIFAKFPDQHTWVIRTPFGERSRVYNGRSGWNATPDTSQVKNVLPITAGRLENEKVLGQLSFPTQIRTSLTRLLTGAEMTIGGGEPGVKDVPDRQVYVVQGLNTRRLPVKLYFDKQTGLLVRLVTYMDTRLGIIASQIDYSDFRDVSGIKMPFHWVQTATDGQNIYDLTGIQINAMIEDTKFAEPAPPRLLTPPMARN
jgi:hypothetical protein